MSYIDETLMKDETIVFRSKPHWIIFTWPVILLCIGIFLFVFGPSMMGLSYLITPTLPAYAIIALLALLFSIITAISALINYQSSEYGITNKRILVKVGFIKRIALEIYLQKIESIKVYQSVMGRVFDYGSITISGIGGSKDPFYTIPKPLEFRRRVQEQIEANPR